MPYAGIAQGNTTNASDCNVFYNGMKARYGSANVFAAGFTVGSDNVDMDDIASVTNFKAAKGLHVLYWSSHGSSYPRLNAKGPKEFESGNTAYVHWCDSTSNPLKVAIFAACYQFDGNTNRSRWANNVMRRCDLRAMAGYHEKGPTHQIDRDIAAEYLSLANAGNSVWYSWEHANAISTKGKDWLVLVYHGEGRQYYRMPGFPGNTYPAPNRSTTPIYRYGGTISDQEVPKAAGLSHKGSSISGSVPYRLEIDISARKALDVSDLKTSASICTDEEMRTVFHAVRENSCVAVPSQKARSFNNGFLSSIVEKEVLDAGIIDVYDTTMAEVLPEGTGEGPETTIGSTKRIFQQHQGIVLEGNCIISSSDAHGIVALNNRWLPTKVGKDVDHIDLAHQDHTVMLTAATRKHVPGMLTDVVSAEPMYIRKGSSYVLEYMLMDSTGRSMLLDAKNID